MTSYSIHEQQILNKTGYEYEFIRPTMFADRYGRTLTQWKQHFTKTGKCSLIHGRGKGGKILKGFKLVWRGIALPNKPTEQHITQIRWRIGNVMYFPLDLSEIVVYNTPVVVFDEDFILNEKERFSLYGYIEGPIPVGGVYQRFIICGRLYETSSKNP